MTTLTSVQEPPNTDLVKKESEEVGNNLADSKSSNYLEFFNSCGCITIKAGNYTYIKENCCMHPARVT